MVTQQTAPCTRLHSIPSRSVVGCDVDPVQAAETILRRYGARAISLLTNPRVLEDGRTLAPRLSANDCYVALEESCRKMGRVALRKYQSDSALQSLGYTGALERIFPDPVAYLTRCIRSVVSDFERMQRREVPTISMDQPLRGSDGDGCLSLSDTLANQNPALQPETALIEQDERLLFRKVLASAMQAIPKNYLLALQRDMAREQERQNGMKVAPETDKERQTVCRARAALSEILKRECGLDNPFVRLLAQQRSSRVRKKSTPSSNWTAERQDNLFRRLLNTPWTERAGATAHPEDNLEEAIVNEVSTSSNVAPPSPEMRQVMRVMDTYMLGTSPTAESSEAMELYGQAWQERQSGRIEEALKLYRAAFALDPTFFAAHNEVGILLCQQGNLRDGLKTYLEIIERAKGEPKYIAATNAADIYLTWFDAGRYRERNIERAAFFARMAMERPTPMRACNLMLAFIKDHYYLEAQKVMETVLRNNLPECAAEKFLQTLAQIRDTDLVAWWNWLDGEIGKDE